MTINMHYVIKCDMANCTSVKLDGPYGVYLDFLCQATLPRVQIDEDWIAVNEKLVCPKHKVKIFKGHGHAKKKKPLIKSVDCLDACLGRGGHDVCSWTECGCPCHTKEKGT